MSERIAPTMAHQHFILVAHPRSGTHWLRSALESNPRMRCLAEVFNANNQALPWSPETPVADIIERALTWYVDDDRVHAAGFVVHSFQPGDMAAFPGKSVNPQWQDMWERLAGIRGARVIHLYRRNLLRRHLSHVIWQRTRIAHRWDPERVTEVSQFGERPPEWIGQPTGTAPMVVLHADSLARDFRDIESRRRHVRDALGHLPMFEIAYEDLLTDFLGTGDRVQRFLGVQPVRLENAMYRLEHRSLPQAIQNYGQLRVHFSGTRWAGFFDD